jgi:hypothetical protein
MMHKIYNSLMKVPRVLSEIDSKLESRFGTEKVVWFYVIGGIAVIIAGAMIWGATGVKKPGAFHESSAYTTNLFVYAYPPDSGVKTYHIPAEIEHFEGSYYVNKLFWPNGGYTEFPLSSCEIDGSLEGYCNSDDGEFKVVITKESAN